MPEIRSPATRGLRVAGHPIHAALSAFPIAFLSGSLLADGVALVHDSALWWAHSFWLVVGGVGAAIPTALAGLLDYAAIAPGERALKTAVVHLTVMLGAVACFAADLMFRAGPQPPHGVLRAATVALDAAGALVLLIGGWLGGELVFSHGVGVARPK